MPPARSTTRWTCSRIRQARACTSVTARATPRRTSSRAGNACRAGTCCIRWAGMHSVCRPRTTPSSTASIRASPPNRPSPISGGRSTRSGSPTTGTARSTPPTRAYVKWTQWIFLQLFKQGLAYEGTVPINWCPSCKTGLANEEVSQGRCERCGAVVERKDMRQWLLRITRYADRLLEDWTSWTGPSPRWRCSATGSAAVRAPRSSSPARRPVAGKEMRVFTTRPDTLYGATYMVLAPEHPLVGALTTPDQREAVAAYQAEARRKSDLERTDLAKDKTGVFIGATAINPATARRGAHLDRRLRACRPMARARSWRCPRTTSATSRSRASSACRS